MESNEIRSYLLNAFVVLAILTVFFFFYKLINPFYFPNLLERLFWIDFVIGLILLALYTSEIEFIIKTRKFKPEFKIRIDKEKSKRIYLTWLFQIALIIFLVSLLINDLFPGLLEFVNFNYMLLTVVAFGAISIMFPHEEKPDKNIKTKMTRKDYCLAIALGVIGAVIIFYKLQALGLLSYAISLISGVFIILLSIFILEDNNTKN